MPTISASAFILGGSLPYCRSTMRRTPASTRAAGRREVMDWLREIWFDWRLAVFLRRKTTKRTGKQLIQRKSDGSLWIAGCPQNIGYAMRGLFNKNPGWHFYRARKWRGLFIASRRVFWLPNSGEFTWPQNVTAFLLPPWPENVECRLIDSRLPTPGDG